MQNREFLVFILVIPIGQQSLLASPPPGMSFTHGFFQTLGTRLTPAPAVIHQTIEQWQRPPLPDAVQRLLDFIEQDGSKTPDRPLDHGCAVTRILPDLDKPT